MSLGWYEYRLIKGLEDWCRRKGLDLDPDPSHNNNLSIRIPGKPDTYQTMPAYARGTVLAYGSVDALFEWAHGWDCCQQYMTALGLQKTIEKAEQRAAGKYVAQILTTP